MSDKVYIKVVDKGPWPKTPWFIKILTMFIPQGNPDFDELYQQVNFWLLEVSVPEGLPCREIGCNERMEPIVAAPMGRNYGVWVDGPDRIEWAEYETADVALFSHSWHKVENDLYYKHRNSGYRTRDKWLKECRSLYALTKRILAEEGEFLDNVQKMSVFAFWMWERKNEDFAVFNELVKVTAHLPVGEARKHWDEAALAAKDLEIRVIEEYYKALVLRSAARIGEKYAKILSDNNCGA